MRKILLLGAASTAMLALSTSAHSAPAATKGLYAGIVGTGAMLTDTKEDHWCNYTCDGPTSSEFQGAIGGTVGYAWIEGNAMFGIEADLSTGFSNEFRVDYNTPVDEGIQWSADWDWLSTIRARAGLTQGNATFFVTAGVAIADVSYSALYFDGGVVQPCNPADTYACASYSETEFGIALGAGVELAMWDGANVKLEYLYVGMPEGQGLWDDQGPNNPDEFVNWTSEAHMARIGINFALN